MAWEIFRSLLGKKKSQPAQQAGKSATPEPDPPPRVYAQPTIIPRAKVAPPEQPKLPLQGAILGEDVETHTPLVIPAKTRERHLYLIGKSGTGKTTLIKNLITQDMHAGVGVAFIDPHGDAAGELLETIPQERIKDVIYFDPASEYAPSFNPLALPYPPDKLTEDIISSFKMFFSEAWGPRLEHLLRFGVLTLLTHGTPHTIKDLQTLFLKPEWKEQLVSNHPDQSIRDFWEHDPNANEKGAVSPILNKLSQLLMPRSAMERVFSQRENTLDFSKILNEQKILIVNLSKGTLGDSPAFLLGGLIVTGIQQAALARAALTEKERKDFYLYVDEFQNYTISSFNSILAEARKYRLFLTLANQNLGQLPRDLEQNIFGNVATLVSFGVSSDDARALQKEMHRSRASVLYGRDFIPVADFIPHQKEALERYEKTLDKQKFDSEWEIKQLKERLEQVQATYRHPDFEYYSPEGKRDVRDSEHGYKQELREEEGRLKESTSELDDVARQLRALNDPNANLSSLRDAFTDFQFKQTTFPDVDDFINLQPHHAFARIERAENVTAFRTNPPPQASECVREQILEAMREQHQHQQRRPPEKHLSLMERARAEEMAFQKERASKPRAPVRVEPVAAEIAATTSEPRPADPQPPPQQEAEPAAAGEPDRTHLSSRAKKKPVPKPKGDLKF